MDEGDAPKEAMLGVPTQPLGGGATTSVGVRVGVRVGVITTGTTVIVSERFAV